MPSSASDLLAVLARGARCILPLSLSASNTCSGRPRSSEMRLVTSTSAEIGRRPTAFSRSCSHLGDGPFFTPRIRRPANIGHGVLRRRPGNSRRDLVSGDGNLPGTGATSPFLQTAEAGGGQIARDAVDARRIAAIGRDGDVDHRIVEAERLRGRLADLRVGGQAR